MGRASGRKNLPRQPVPGTPEGDEIGLSIRQDPGGSPIPGLTGNISNYETVQQRPAAPQPDESFDEYRGMMAHGVPNDSAATSERAQAERGSALAQHAPPSPPQHHVPRVRPVPVPVYIVEEASSGTAFYTASPRHVTVPAASGLALNDPVRIAGRNAKRNRIMLLNESQSSDIRIAVRPSDLVSGGGALLPWPNNSYMVIETQDELFALSADTGTPVISIIEEFEREL